MLIAGLFGFRERDYFQLGVDTGGPERGEPTEVAPSLGERRHAGRPRILRQVNRPHPPPGGVVESATFPRGLVGRASEYATGAGRWGSPAPSRSHR